jgi:divalent metal cation (Fe/Co/Zn/Cd) transporter
MARTLNRGTGAAQASAAAEQQAAARLSLASNVFLVQVLQADPRVRAFHRLRTRRAGSFRLMDVHVLLDDALSFPEAHAAAEEVENAVRAAVPNLDVTVHPEPFEAETRHQQEAHVPDQVSPRHPS